MANLQLGPCDARTRIVHDASTTEARGKYCHRRSTPVLLKFELAYIHPLDAQARPLNNFAHCCVARMPVVTSAWWTHPPYVGRHGPAIAPPMPCTALGT